MFHPTTKYFSSGDIIMQYKHDHAITLNPIDLSNYLNKGYFKFNYLERYDEAI